LKEQNDQPEMPNDHCFVCGKRFAKPSLGVGRCWPGTLFSATGNYGSTVFDPSPGNPPPSLSIFICDHCVITRRSRIFQQRCELPLGISWNVAEYLAASPVKELPSESPSTFLDREMVDRAIAERLASQVALIIVNPLLKQVVDILRKNRIRDGIEEHNGCGDEAVKLIVAAMDQVRADERTRASKE